MNLTSLISNIHWSAIILAGESISFLSKNKAIWTISFFPIYEEPSLEKRFGKEYLEYKKNVRRWIPRLKPYNPDSI